MLELSLSVGVIDIDGHPCVDRVGKTGNLSGDDLIRIIVSLLILSTGIAWAQPQRVAVLPIDGEAVELTARLSLTDQVRRMGLTFLVPSSEYRILTRENLETMLPPGKTMADCVGECAIMTARQMKVDFVITGQVVQIEGQLRLNLGVYATNTATPLANITAGGDSPVRLEVDLTRKLHRVFTAVLDHVGGTNGQRQSVGDIVTVEFRSEPAGATVTVDGRTLCETPCKEDLEVGRYRVSMAKVGYVSKEANEQVLKGRSVSMRLAKDEGGMQIRSLPRQMDIFMNGKHVGETPQRFSRSPKLYKVQVGREECAIPHIQNVSVARGRVIEIDFRPSVHPAGLKIVLKDDAGNHVRAGVYVDGEKLGETFHAMQLPVCTKSVTLRAHGHPMRVPVQLERDVISTLKVRWDGPSIFVGARP